MGIAAFRTFDSCCILWSWFSLPVRRTCTERKGKTNRKIIWKITYKYDCHAWVDRLLHYYTYLLEYVCNALVLLFACKNRFPSTSTSTVYIYSNNNNVHYFNFFFFIYFYRFSFELFFRCCLRYELQMKRNTRLWLRLFFFFRFVRSHYIKCFLWVCNCMQASKHISLIVHAKLLKFTI